MTKLVWDAAGQRYYEAGVDRGVLYPNNGPGVAWNGLINVNDAPSGGEGVPYYIDGIKFLGTAAPEEFSASIEAYTYPEEFALCDGTAFDGNGLSFGLQPRSSFGLSYRTLIGNDLDGTDHGYKIHLIYNALAAPSAKPQKTLNNSPEAMSFNWNMTATPVAIDGRRPTPHLIIDSTKTDPTLLRVLELYLYGDTSVVPRLPTPKQLALLFGSWTALGIETNFLGVGPGISRFMINYAPNPSFEASGSDLNLATNLFTNPAFETLGSLFAMRRNLTINGIPLTNTQYWISGAALTRQQVGGKWWMNAPSGTYTYASATGIVGRFYAASMRIAGPVGATVTTASTDNQVGEVTKPTTVVIPASGEIVVKMSASRAVSGTAINFGLFPQVSGIRITEMLLEEVAVIGDVPAAPYFDGASTNTDEFSHAWEGGVSASPSIQYANTANGIASGFDGSSYVISSTTWKQTGFRSIRILPRRVNSYMYLSSTALGLVVGKKYTLIVTQHQEQIQTGTLASSARSLYWQEGATQYGKVTGPNAIGSRELRSKFTITTAGVFVLYNGSANEDMWYDNLAIIEGDYDGEYFDGSTAASGDFTYVFAGASHASVSYKKAPAVLGITSPLTEGLGFLSKAWSDTGTSSLRIGKKPKTTWTGEDNAVVGPQLSLIQGNTYTISAKIRLTKVQASPVTSARKMSIGTPTPINSPAAPNQVGVFQIDWTFVAPVTGSYPIVFWNGGGQSDDDVWWDAFIFIEGGVSVAFFDGSSAPFLFQNQIVVPSWSDATNNRSAFKYFPDLPAMANEGDSYLIEENFLVYQNGHWVNYGSVFEGIKTTS
jgi:hypothetical protein